MTPEETTPANELLIRSLLESYLEDRGQIEITPTERPGAVYWQVKASGNDTAKLVGRMGAHLEALTVVVKALGRAAGTLYLFKFMEPDRGLSRSEPRRVPAVFDYDTSGATSLIEALFAGLGVGEYRVEAGKTGTRVDPSTPMTFTILIYVRDRADLDELTLRGDDGKMSTIGAIGTLLRARGHLEGVKLSVEVRLV